MIHCTGTFEFGLALKASLDLVNSMSKNSSHIMYTFMLESIINKIYRKYDLICMLPTFTKYFVAQVFI